MDLNHYSKEEILRGVDKHGSPLLPQALSYWAKMTDEVLVGSCKKCINSYIDNLLKHFEMNTGFKLKNKYNGIRREFGSNVRFFNKNLTDDQAIWLLKNHPAGEKLFDTLGDVPEPKQKLTNDQLLAMTDEEAAKLSGTDKSRRTKLVNKNKKDENSVTEEEDPIVNDHDNSNDAGGESENAQTKETDTDK